MVTSILPETVYSTGNHFFLISGGKPLAHPNSRRLMSIKSTIGAIRIEKQSRVVKKAMRKENIMIKGTFNNRLKKENSLQDTALWGEAAAAIYYMATNQW